MLVIASMLELGVVIEGGRESAEGHAGDCGKTVYVARRIRQCRLVDDQPRAVNRDVAVVCSRGAKAVDDGRVSSGRQDE